MKNDCQFYRFYAMILDSGSFPNGMEHECKNQIRFISATELYKEKHPDGILLGIKCDHVDNCDECVYYKKGEPNAEQ